MSSDYDSATESIDENILNGLKIEFKASTTSRKEN